MTSTFDQQYRLTDQTSGAVQDVSFTLDAAGNIDAITDAVSPSSSQGFDQDVLDRLTTDTGAYGTKTYTYDASGNRLTRVQGATTQTLTYTANSNRMVTHDGTTVSRDAAGNTTIDPAENLSFTYGTHNRMFSAYVGGVLKASYGYNGRGQRVKKVEAISPNRTFVYHYGLGGELIGETIYSSGGAKIGERDYLWLDSLPLAQSERAYSGGTLTSSAFVYLHADQLNTPRLATNGSGTVVWRWDSDAFGVGTANLDPDGDTNQVNVRLRFPGQYLDEETGLAYNYFRDYDPVTGRYVESDPIGLAGGINTFAYANGNPLSMVDPLGLLSLNDVADYAAGFGDTLSFGLTSYIRSQWDINSVDKCSKSYSAGMFTEIGLEVGLTGASFALRGAAKGITQAAARAGQNWHGVRGVSAVHHINPLFEGLFPTAALPSWIRNGSWNLELLTLKDHAAAHAALARVGNYLKALVNPVTTTARAGYITASQCGCN